jgi:hypothetical protein
MTWHNNSWKTLFSTTILEHFQFSNRIAHVGLVAEVEQVQAEACAALEGVATAHDDNA